MGKDKDISLQSYMGKGQGRGYGLAISDEAGKATIPTCMDSYL